MRSLTVVLTLCLAGTLIATAQDKKAVYPEGSAKGGNFSPAIIAGGTLYVSGQEL
jgi:enamine deaminase RidA (YjgF/YER057c/UK114 family)